MNKRPIGFHMMRFLQGVGGGRRLGPKRSHGFQGPPPDALRLNLNRKRRRREAPHATARKRRRKKR